MRNYGISPWVCVVVSFLSQLAYGDENQDQAILLYQQAESYYASQQYDQALTLYQKAKGLLPDDTLITVKESHTQKLVARGRATERVSYDNSSRIDYRPNQRIESINDFFTEQARRANPPKLILRWITMADPTRDDVLDGGETAAIVFEIRNEGQSEALNVRLMSNSDQLDGLDFQNQVMVGNIPAQESMTATLLLNAARNIGESTRTIKTIAIEQAGFDSNTIDVIVPTRSHRPEKLEVLEHITRDFNNDNRIEPAEVVDLEILLKNAGLGVSKKLTAKLKLGDNVFFGPESGPEIPLEKMFPGEVRSIKYSFLTNRRLNHNDNIPVLLQVVDEDGTEQISTAFEYHAFVPKDKTNVTITPKVRDIVPPPVGLKSNDVDSNIPVTGKIDKYAVAVVIGNKNYQSPGVPAVKYAHNDAQAVKKYLVNTLGFLEKNILYFEDATGVKFSETFGSAQNYAGRLYNYIEPGKSNIFIYYSGHGAPDLKSRDRYFIPVDTNPAYLRNSGFSLNTFYQNLSKLPAKQITIVLDTCFSGDSDGGFLFNSISPIYLQSEPDNVPVRDNMVIFTSSQNEQVSTWYHDQKHGLFTYFFLKGLRGDADADKNHKITTTELNAFLTKNVPAQARRLNGNEQVPTLSQRRDAIMVDYSNPVSASN